MHLGFKPAANTSGGTFSVTGMQGSIGAKGNKSGWFNV